MKSFDNITVTNIDVPLDVYSKKHRTLEMKNRSSFGLSFCKSGQITYSMNGKTYISVPGYAVILPQNSSYSLYGVKDGIFPIVNFSCENFECDEIMVLPLENPQECIKDLELIKSLFLFEGNRLKIYAKFYELISKVFITQSSKLNPLQPVIKFIEENISNPELSNTVLAKHIGISEVYLRKLFSNLYNTTPKQYILDIRIRKAKQMLTDTPFTVTAISEACGFSSLYHFCRAFKERTGTTPTQYARVSKTTIHLF